VNPTVLLRFLLQKNSATQAQINTIGTDKHVRKLHQIPKPGHPAEPLAKTLPEPAVNMPTVTPATTVNPMGG
jgi:hypothetical protein